MDGRQAGWDGLAKIEKDGLAADLAKAQVHQSATRISCRGAPLSFVEVVTRRDPHDSGVGTNTEEYGVSPCTPVGPCKISGVALRKVVDNVKDGSKRGGPGVFI
jgi:hypothetical protein